MSSRVEEYRRKLEAYEQQKQQAAQAVDLMEILRRSTEVKSVHVDGVGEVRYGALTFADLVEISKHQTNEERVIATVYHMLRKAYPELTIDHVRNMPFDLAAKILDALSRELNFLAQR